MKHLLASAVTVLTLSLAASASPRDELKAVIEAVKKSPDETALREKAIRLAAALKPAPSIPEEARKAMVKGAVFQKESKGPDGLKKAVAALREATRLAPWWADAYYNLSVVQELSQDYRGAETSLKLFLLAAPESETRDGKDRLYALEAKAELATGAAEEKAKTLIVPGVGIGPVRLGMSESQVIAVLGAPLRRTPPNNLNGQSSLGFDTYDVTLSRDGKVLYVGSNHRGFVTSEGVGVGSSKAEVTAAMGSCVIQKGGVHPEWEGWRCSQGGIYFAFDNPQSLTTVDSLFVERPQ